MLTKIVVYMLRSVLEQKKTNKKCLTSLCTCLIVVRAKKNGHWDYRYLECFRANKLFASAIRSNV